MKTLHKIILVIILLIIVFLLYYFLYKKEIFEDINLYTLENSFIIEDIHINNNTIKINNTVYDISGNDNNNDNTIIEKNRSYSNNYECNKQIKSILFILNIENHKNYIYNYGTDEDIKMLENILNNNIDDETIILILNYISDKYIIYNSTLNSTTGWIDIYNDTQKSYIEIELNNERILNGIIIKSFSHDKLLLMILVSDFTVELSNDGVTWETLKNKNNDTEPKIFHINYTMTNTINKITINTETGNKQIEPITPEDSQTIIETISTYEIENSNSKYLILLDTFIKCKYIRVYPKNYYINYNNYIINNEDAKQFFNSDICNTYDPMPIGMNLGLVTTEVNNIK